MNVLFEAQKPSEEASRVFFLDECASLLFKVFEVFLSFFANPFDFNFFFIFLFFVRIFRLENERELLVIKASISC